MLGDQNGLSSVVPDAQTEGAGGTPPLPPAEISQAPSADYYGKLANALLENPHNPELHAEALARILLDVGEIRGIHEKLFAAVGNMADSPIMKMLGKFA